MTEVPISTVDSPDVILELIYKMKIKDVMQKDLITADRNDTLRHIKQKLKENDITGVPIAENKRLLGMVSMDHIMQAFDSGHIDETADKHMTKKLIVLEEDMPLSFGISYFQKYTFHRFPVLNKERELTGIITPRDITIALLVEVNKIVEKLEKKMRISGGPDLIAHANIYEQFHISKFDFENAGKASTNIKMIMKKLTEDTKLTRRVAVASYELEMNIVVHSEGGQIVFTAHDNRVEIAAKDRGPGIPNVNEALKEGYTTANEWIRSLGFGAGMGLPNAKRVSDEFTIESSPHGTSVRSIIYLDRTGETNNEHTGH